MKYEVKALHHDRRNTLEVVDAQTGILWILRIVENGERYGRELCLINNGETLVEFYDGRFDHSVTEAEIKGQFVSRYCLSTMLERDQRFGLDLMGNVPSWKVSRETMTVVSDWLAEYATAN